jgi:hypothetical protein
LRQEIRVKLNRQELDDWKRLRQASQNAIREYQKCQQAKERYNDEKLHGMVEGAKRRAREAADNVTAFERRMEDKHNKP